MTGYVKTGWLAIVLMVAIALPLKAGEPRLELVEVNRIWSGEQHAAFTDLIRFKDRFLCVFREGESHASRGGVIRLLASDTGSEWTSVAVVALEGEDLRDPKLDVMPDGRLMLLGGASYYDPTDPEAKVAKLRRNFISFSDDGTQWTTPQVIDKDGEWIWRVTWKDDTAYSVAYSFPGEARLLRTTDGVDYTQVVPALVTEMNPTEATIRFDDDGEALCLIRREGEKVGAKYTRVPALLGTSRPPYEAWEWKDVGVYLGGPNFVQVPGGVWIAGGRTRLGPARMTLGRLDVEAGTLDGLLHLPSGGDCSYPGMVWFDDRLWVSYYSSHEGQSSIYFAQVKLAPQP